MKLSVLAGATSQSVNVFVRDSSSTTGGGLTGLAYNSAGLVAYYTHAGANATATAITLATLAAANSAYSSGGFKEIDATNMPGWYRFDLPNACLATSKGRSVAIHLKGATNMAPLPFEIELVAVDNQSATAFITGVNSLAPPPNWNLMSIDSNGRVDVIKIAGTTQTARDIGASVLLASAQRVKLDAAQPDYAPAKAGDAMTLTSGERDATAVVVESHLLDEGDGQMLVNAIVGAIGNTNIDQAVLVAAIRADLERTNGNLYTLLARLTSTRAGYLDNLSGGAVALAADLVTANAGVVSIYNDTQTLTTRIGRNLSITITGGVSIASVQTGAIDADAFTQDAIDAVQSGLATAAGVAALNNLSAAQVTAAVPTADQNADALLGRNVAGGSSTGRLVKEALYALRNKVAIVGTTQTVYSTDDTTAAWTATLTAAAGADPISAIDPTA